MAIYFRYHSSINGRSNDYLEKMSWDSIIQLRNMLLEMSDPLMIIDRFETFSEDVQTTIKTFRQTLRDIPQTYDEETIVFPLPPTLMQDVRYMDRNVWTRLQEADYYKDYPEAKPEGWTQPMTDADWEEYWGIVVTPSVDPYLNSFNSESS